MFFTSLYTDFSSTFPLMFISKLHLETISSSLKVFFNSLIFSLPTITYPARTISSKLESQGSIFLTISDLFKTSKYTLSPSFALNLPAACILKIQVPSKSLSDTLRIICFSSLPILFLIGRNLSVETSAFLLNSLI